MRWLVCLNEWLGLARDPDQGKYGVSNLIQRAAVALLFAVNEAMAGLTNRYYVVWQFATKPFVGLVVNMQFFCAAAALAAVPILLQPQEPPILP